MFSWDCREAGPFQGGDTTLERVDNRDQAGPLYLSVITWRTEWTRKEGSGQRDKKNMGPIITSWLFPRLMSKLSELSRMMLCFVQQGYFPVLDKISKAACMGKLLRDVYNPIENIYPK